MSKSKRKDTRTDLVAELEKLPLTQGLEFIINDAKRGEFHDYKNQKYTCGKVTLVNFLAIEIRNHPSHDVAQALVKIRRDVMDGVYDETPDEEDKAEMRKFAPQAMWPLLGL